GHDVITITPFHPLVDRVPAFAECKRRIFMSATLADDSSVVRSFGIGAKAVSQPIAPPSLAGVGERMILVPALTQFPADRIVPGVKEIVREFGPKTGVVILTPSEAFARAWEDVADVAIGNEDVTEAVRCLTD